MNRLHRMAAFVRGLEPEAVPEGAHRLAKLALADVVGVTLAALDEPVADVVRRHLGTAAGGTCTAAVAAGRVGPAEAAFANAAVGHALDLDDSNMVLGGHPSVVLWPAALAVAEHRGRSGREALVAYVTGFEVMTALARAVNFEHYERGWHPTATLGVFGAAAAAARLLALDARAVEAALGLAASMASGIKANFGAMAKPIGVGEAARRGVTCALLAEAGATASADALEGRQGFLAVYNGPGHFRPEEIDRLGEGFELLRSGLQFKKYACCGSTHAPIDAALILREDEAVRRDGIAEVRVGLNPRRRPHVDRPGVRDALSGKFSVQYTVAAALADGAVGLRHFADEAVARPDLRAMMDRVSLFDLPASEDPLGQACEVRVVTRAGETAAVRLAGAQGRSAEDYAGYARAKLADCVAGRLDVRAADALFGLIDGFERCPDAGAVMRAAAGRRARQLEGAA